MQCCLLGQEWHGSRHYLFSAGYEIFKRKEYLLFIIGKCIFGCVWADADIAAGLFACAFQAAFYVPHIPPTGNRDSSKNMIERTAVTLFFLPIPFFMIPLYQPQSLNELHDYNWLIKTLSRKCKYPVAQQKRNKGCVLQVEYTVNPEGYISHATVLNQAPRAFRKSVMLVFQSLRNVPTVLRHGKSTLST